jgi:hypothetical protein
MQLTIAATSTRASKEIYQYVAFLHRCMAGQANLTLTIEQQTQLEKLISRQV